MPTLPVAGVPAVSALILGCGGLSPERQDRADGLLDAFVAAGGTTLDTAHIYGHGQSERCVGAWLAARGNRERIVVITKGAHHDADWKPRVRPEVIRAELADSLERLQTDHVDLYLLHRDDPAAPVGPIMQCLAGEVAAGRVRAFGGSNWSPARLEEANAYARGHGLPPMVASSPNLALAVAGDPPHMGHATVSGDAAAQAWYRRTHFPLLAWSASAQGFFSDRADAEDERLRRRFARYEHPDNWERRRRCRTLAAELGHTPTQVALAWLLCQDMAAAAIVGPGSTEHLEEATGALDVHLTPEQVAWLDLRETRATDGG